MDKPHGNMGGREHWRVNRTLSDLPATHHFLFCTLYHYLPPPQLSLCGTWRIPRQLSMTGLLTWTFFLPFGCLHSWCLFERLFPDRLSGPSHPSFLPPTCAVCILIVFVGLG